MPLRRDIQGLRALAVLAVIGAHAAGWPRGGFAGVDVFFVISGFLITGMLLREQRATGRIRLARFYGRRARRLLPAALVTVGAVIGAAFALFGRARAEQVLWDGVSALLLVSNWRFTQQGTDYFHAGDAVSPLQNFWSLSVEEQFYLVWPGLLIVSLLFVPAVARRGRAVATVVAAWAVVVIAASFGWALLQGASAPTAAYFSTATRAWEFALGALLAAGVPVLRRIPAAAAALLAWIGVAGVVASLLLIDPATVGFPGPWAAAPTAATVLALAGGVAASPRALFPWTNPLAVVVGNASYSLYLWHFPVVVFAAALLPASPWSLPLTLAIVAVVGFASYAIVEQPLRYAPFLGGRVPVADAGADADAAPDVGLDAAPARPVEWRRLPPLRAPPRSRRAGPRGGSRAPATTRAARAWWPRLPRRTRRRCRRHPSSRRSSRSGFRSRTPSLRHRRSSRPPGRWRALLRWWPGGSGSARRCRSRPRGWSPRRCCSCSPWRCSSRVRFRRVPARPRRRPRSTTRRLRCRQTWPPRCRRRPGRSCIRRSMR
ncbi:acyltransferase family protein [Microbacterium hominis]|uniref:acyltransferase family protein n=1 Tax=Microbacterium hominis TaxID=162426 RepID=UPI000B2DADE7|nr:acyltransferase [Microbacterium hominis]